MEENNKPEDTSVHEEPPAPPLPTTIAAAEAAAAPPLGEKSNSWMGTDDSALTLFIQEAKKAKGVDSDLLDDDDEDVWTDIAERLPGKSAVNCIMRYARLKLEELESQITSRSAGNAALLPSSGHKRSADISDASSDSKKAKLEETLALWTDEETNMLREIVGQYPNSELVSSCIFSLSQMQCC